MLILKFSRTCVNKQVLNRSSYSLFLVLVLPCIFSLLVLTVSNESLASLARYAAFYLFMLVPLSLSFSNLFFKRYQTDFIDNIFLGYPPAVLFLAICFIATKSLGLERLLIIFPITIIFWQIT